MKLKNVIFVFLIIGLSFLSGCKEAYLLEDKPEVGENQAILLIDIQGSSPINYVQLGGVFPAINIRFKAKHDEVVAVVVPVGIKGLEFNCFTYEGKSSGYIPIGYTATSYGYYPVRSVPIDILKPGIYFFGTLNTDTRDFSSTPNVARLEGVRAQWRVLFNGLDPINFSWQK